MEIIETINPIYLYTIRVLSLLVLLLSALPLVRKDYWIFRICEFPRFQKLIINLLFLTLYLFFYKLFVQIDFVIIGLLIINFFYLTYQVYPYLPIAKKQVIDADKNQKKSISLLVSNVYQYNRKSKKLTDLVQKEKADVVILLETDQWWKNECLTAFGNQYKYQLLQDQEDTYGMLFFSKFELENPQLKYLISDHIPSIETNLILEDNRRVKLYSIHPEPPTPTQSKTSTERDAEILLVGDKAKNDKLPVIVAGDLNDVAWSFSTDLFLKTSGLLDARRGRGFYSTFHAKNPFFRWPLDHVFCSEHFRLVKIKRMPAINSDHFPIYIELYLSEEKENGDKMTASKEEKATKQEKIQNGKDLND